MIPTRLKVAVLLIFVLSSAVAQLTFSQGWGKRTDAPFFKNANFDCDSINDEAMRIVRRLIEDYRRSYRACQQKHMSRLLGRKESYLQNPI
ncbi:hypothetical protein M514_07078 [Trichuris suis]|uniref:Uncharacterized protein n=1 Tax=Trichuris suis TaxID=68888 RepID=A0A085N8N5_9BILA|nr:hypothetical protein M514_07078 [Trichuris suis]